MKLFVSILVFPAVFVVGLVGLTLWENHYGLTEFWRGGMAMLISCISVDAAVGTWKEWDK